MNRNDEYRALCSALSETPLKLDYTVDRALPRFQKWQRQRRIKRAVGIPLGTLAALCTAFILLVNLSPRFFETAERMPWLVDFAEYVQFGDSMGRAAGTGSSQPEQVQAKAGVAAADERSCLKRATHFSALRPLFAYSTAPPK